MVNKPSIVPDIYLRASIIEGFLAIVFLIEEALSPSTVIARTI